MRVGSCMAVVLVVVAVGQRVGSFHAFHELLQQIADELAAYLCAASATTTAATGSSGVSPGIAAQQQAVEGRHTDNLTEHGPGKRHGMH
jgi:hypothetical protein